MCQFGAVCNMPSQELALLHTGAQRQTNKAAEFMEKSSGGIGVICHVRGQGVQAQMDGHQQSWSYSVNSMCQCDRPARPIKYERQRRTFESAPCQLEQPLFGFRTKIALP